MRTLRQQAPGLDGRTLLRLAHDNVIRRGTASRRGWTKETKAEREGRTLEAQAERMKEMDERQEKKRREEQDRLVKAAKRAAGINVRSSPGHSNGPRTLDEDLRAIARIGLTADEISEGTERQPSRQGAQGLAEQDDRASGSIAGRQGGGADEKGD